MMVQSHGTPRINNPRADSHSGLGGDNQASSRVMGKDFYSVLKASGATAGLPPLRPTSSTVPTTAGSMQRSMAVSDSAGPDASILDPALTALAFRAGSLQGLPELQVLVQDAVTNTIKNIHPIVVDMVTKLITKETVRVTTRSAYTLAKEQLSTLEANQDKFSEAFERVQETFNQQLTSWRAERNELEECYRQALEAQQALANRVHMVESDLQRVPALENRILEADSKAATLRVKLESCLSELQTAQRNAVDFEQRCHQLYATPQNLEKAMRDVKEYGQVREKLTQESLDARLKNYVLTTDLTKALETREVQTDNLLQRDRDNVEVKWRGIWDAHNETRAVLFGQYVTKDDFNQDKQQQDQKHFDLCSEIADQILALQSKDGEQASMIEDLLSLRAEREQMEETFRQARTEVDEQSEELRQRFDSRTESLSVRFEEIPGILDRLSKQQQSIDSILNLTAHMKEEVGNDRMRASATFSQQQHNRKELNYLIHRIEELDDIKATMNVQRTDSMENTTSIDNLQEQVSQWADAIYAQKELREDASKLRSDLEEMRGEIAKLANDQQLGIVNLRALHSSWLTGAVAG